MKRGESMEYRSRTEFFGLPLVHVSTGAVRDGRYTRGIARGWIALGDIAFGVILSAGGLSLGGISVGGVTLGLLSLGGLSLGGIAVGGLAVGIMAVGGVAVGVVACGGAALAWKAAYGGFAVAGEAAVGGRAIAPHANDQYAVEYLKKLWNMADIRHILEKTAWIPVVAVLLIVRGIVHQKKKRMEEGTPSDGT